MANHYILQDHQNSGDFPEHDGSNGRRDLNIKLAAQSPSLHFVGDGASAGD